jgi:hypothetical protein
MRDNNIYIYPKCQFSLHKCVNKLIISNDKFYRKKDINIDMVEKQPTIIYPQCDYNGPVHATFNDGDSRECPKCLSHVHECINRFVVSNAGPASCKHCKKKYTDWVKDIDKNTMSMVFFN